MTFVKSPSHSTVPTVPTVPTQRDISKQRRARANFVGRSFVLAGVLALAGGVAFAEGSHLRPGNWEITVAHELVGMAYAPPPLIISKCITPEDASDPQKMLKKQSADCDSKDVKVDGHKVVFSFVCHKRGGTQVGSGELVYAGDSYKGTMTMEMDDPRIGKVKMVEHIDGKRTGECAP